MFTTGHRCLSHQFFELRVVKHFLKFILFELQHKGTGAGDPGRLLSMPFEKYLFLSKYRMGGDGFSGLDPLLSVLVEQHLKADLALNHKIYRGGKIALLVDSLFDTVLFHYES